MTFLLLRFDKSKRLSPKTQKFSKSGSSRFQSSPTRREITRMRNFCNDAGVMLPRVVVMEM